MAAVKFAHQLCTHPAAFFAYFSHPGSASRETVQENAGGDDG
jgi:hypothetical protein